MSGTYSVGGRVPLNDTTLPSQASSVPQSGCMLVTGRIKLDGAIQYILAQLVGACVAAWACQSLWPAEAVASANLGIPLPNPMPGEGVAWPTVQIVCVVEFILTFLLMTAGKDGIYGNTDDVANFERQ